MAGRNHGEEWVETAEEVVVTQEECLPADSTAADLEPAETPIQRLLDTVGHGDDAESHDGFNCEECQTLFQEQSDPASISGPSFILDFPAAVGLPQRALLTLPYGLMIGRSSIPSAGVGVTNHGPSVAPGMHFGPYEGDVATMENCMTSDFSWEISKGEDEYEYIDAARESHSNWMRYINCARNKDEANMLAVQYKGSILYHCCRTVNPGDELLVWPSSKLLNHFSDAWTQVWLMKLNAAESNSTAASPVFVCSHCLLSFTTESFLQRHSERFHTQPDGTSAAPPAESVDPGHPASAAGSSDSAASPAAVPVDPVESNTCSDCGKVFKQVPHLRRHKLCVHANRRPYCCPQCRRSFSQASGLIRHQQVHRKQAATEETAAAANQAATLGEEGSLPPSSEPTAVAKETKDTNASQAPPEALDEAEPALVSAGVAEASQHGCSDSRESFTSEESLREREAASHPYVCSVCQRAFRQHCDLSRHLRGHRRRSEAGERKNPALDESALLPFSCADCSVAFSSVDRLQRHISEHHSEEMEADNGGGVPAPAGDDQARDPDFIPHLETVQSPQKRPSQRPQRLGAASKISAITKLIAPKRRTTVRKRPLANAIGTAEPQAPSDQSATPPKHKRFSCNRCKRTYAKADELTAHTCALRQHKCAQCGMTFHKSGFLRRHEQVAHAGAASHGCDSCAKVFPTSGKLKRHQKNDACRRHQCTTELFSCSFCPFSFTLKSYLIKHIKRHHPAEYLAHPEADAFADQLRAEREEKELVCPHCDKSFAGAPSFKAHACVEVMKVLYLCTDCGKGFTNHYGLKQHQRVHTGEKPYSCPHCGKSFSYSGQLSVHLRTHTGEKPFLCTHCGDSFRQSGDLKRHERKHTGVRPYSCPECCKSFSRLQSLKAHQMLHRGQRMFKCSQCGKSFSRNYHLRRHHQKMHL